jgi:hypothetical protein
MASGGKIAHRDLCIESVVSQDQISRTPGVPSRRIEIIGSAQGRLVRAMPQYGHAPGPLLATLGCIAQVKLPLAGGLGVIAALAVGAAVGALPPMFIGVAGAGAEAGLCAGAPAMLIPPMAIPQEQPLP